MSSRRPELTFEEAAAIVGLDPTLDTLFEKAIPVPVAALDDSWSRRLTITIERVGNHDANFNASVARSLAQYVAGLLTGTCGAGADENFVSVHRDAGKDRDMCTMKVHAESYRADHVEPKT